MFDDGLPYIDCENCDDGITIVPVGSRCPVCHALAPQYVPSQEEIKRAIRKYRVRGRQRINEPSIRVYRMLRCGRTGTGRLYEV